ncbi:MAG: Ku protein [Actinomycetota bacterium]|nr:Ku protein [Actinomycetota bacterium]
MRAIWKGSISFGLVSIGVKLYTATEERDVSFHQVRRTDGSRIRYKRVAEADGEEVAYGDIAKGYQLDNGETVVLTDEDFADLPLPTARVVDVLQFVPIEQIDPIYFAKSYYLEPEKTAVKPYVLLRDALDSSGQAGLVKVAIRNREQLATLRVRDGVIVMETMIWPDEVREPAFGFLDNDVDLRPQERTMAESLVTSMSGDFDASEYTDDYRAALQEVIDAKVEGREVVEAEEAQPSAGNVVDLMSALRASVAAAKKGRGEVNSSVPEKTAKKTPAKKTPANKTPANKTPANKAAAKKTAAKKTAAKKTAPKGTQARKAPVKRAAKDAPANRAARKSA